MKILTPNKINHKKKIILDLKTKKLNMKINNSEKNLH